MNYYIVKAPGFMHSGGSCAGLVSPISVKNDARVRPPTSRRRLELRPPGLGQGLPPTGFEDGSLIVSANTPIYARDTLVDQGAMGGLFCKQVVCL
jgi:hypothetical protein